MIQPAITYSYAIAGRSLCIRASDEWAATLIRNFLRDFHLDSETDISTPDYIVGISSHALAPVVPQGLDTFEVAYGHCSTDGQRYYLDVEDSLIVVDADASLRVWIGDTPRARQPLALANLMAYVLEISLRRCGLYQLHGAGLAPPDQSAGALILGSSGSGKSTLTALLASRGWSYMTDDALLVNDQGDMIIARGIRRFFAASEATLASCSLSHLGEALRGTMLSDPNKRRLEPTVAFPGRFINSCVPRVLFFVSISGEDQSEVAPITQAETMSRLIRSNPWASYDRFTAGDHLRVLSRLSTQCSGYSFRGGLDLLADPSLAETLLLPLVDKSAKNVAR
jgi:hypothetical protein